MNAYFLQVEWKFQRYRSDIWSLNEMKLEFSFPSCSTMLVYLETLSISRPEMGAELLLKTTTRHALSTWQPVSERILTPRFWSRLQLRKAAIVWLKDFVTAPWEPYGLLRATTRISVLDLWYCCLFYSYEWACLFIPPPLFCIMFLRWPIRRPYWNSRYHVMA